MQSYQCCKTLLGIKLCFPKRGHSNETSVSNGKNTLGDWGLGPTLVKSLYLLEPQFQLYNRSIHDSLVQNLNITNAIKLLSFLYEQSQ